MTEEQKTDWSKIAAWTFGIWAVMVPLSAAIIGYYQRQTIERQDLIRAEIATLRLYVVEDSKGLHVQQEQHSEAMRDHEGRIRRLEQEEHDR